MIAAIALAAFVAQAAGAPAAAPARVIADVRVHGNHSTPDADVLAIAALKPGDALSDAALEAARQRLRDSGRFTRVETLVRSRSLDGSNPSVIILIEERFVINVPGPGGAVLRPVTRLVNRPMFLPIVDFSDYGFSYGLRTSFIDVGGQGGRVSVPFTWGAEKHVAAEYTRRFGGDNRLRAEATASWRRRENPFYLTDDSRREASGGLAWQVATPVRVRARAGYTSVTFAEAGDDFPWVSAEATLDTRLDPDLPREAVYLSAEWTRLAFDRYAPANRLRTDVRGFLGLLGQSVLAVRGLHVMSDVPLPPFERALLGGPSTVRGSEFGYATGDNLAVASIELRVPVSSPLANVGKTGFSLFADTGAAYDRGTSIGDADFRWGYGAGLFFSAAILKLNLDVATDGRGNTRVHLASGFRF